MAACSYFAEALEALSDRVPEHLWKQLRVHRIYCAARRAKPEIKMEVNCANLSDRDFDTVLGALGEAVSDGPRFTRLTVYKQQRLVLALATPNL